MPADPELHAARLADLAHLVPGLVHELSSPASVLRGNVGAVVDHADTFGRFLRGLDGGSDARRLRAELELDDACEDLSALAGESVTALDDLVALLGEIRSYATRAESDEDADIAASVAAALRLVTYETKYRAAVTVAVGDVPRVALPQVQLTQLVLCLVLNASQAIGCARLGPGPLGRISIQARAEGDEIRLEVRDDGPGIAEDDLPKIFEAGFTTRDGARGMGLAVSRRLARAAGGDLVSTGTAGGACFEARLPAVSDDESSEVIAPAHKT